MTYKLYHKMRNKHSEVRTTKRWKYDEGKYLVRRGLENAVLPYKLEHDQDKASFREAKSKCLFHVSIDISLETYFLLPHIGAVHLLLEAAAALKKCNVDILYRATVLVPHLQKVSKTGVFEPFSYQFQCRNIVDWQQVTDHVNDLRWELFQIRTHHHPEAGGRSNLWNQMDHK